MKIRTDHLIEQAAALYPFDASTLRLIHSTIYSPNDIYSFIKDNKEYILRIATHDEDHTFKTTGEMEWLAFLHKRGISVSMPLPMSDGQLVSLLVSKNKYHDVCAFEKAHGTHCDKNNPNTWNTDIVEDWGYTMGCMHRETKEFRNSDDCFRRGIFDGRDGLNDSLVLVPMIREFAHGLVSQLLALPRNKDTFGLIHSDFHLNNFFALNNKVHVFDFDDSWYGYFALDIGIVLHHALIWSVPDAIEMRQEDAERTVLHFMKGYKKANKLDEQALKSILLFMWFRQLCNFGWILKPDNQMPEEQHNLLNGYTIEGCRITDDIFTRE